MSALQLKSDRLILVIIVVAQFFCTSVWFAGNGVIGALTDVFQLPLSAIGTLTSAVQFGFIGGTLTFAVFAFADRYAPSKVFFLNACLAAAFNGLIILDQNTLASLLILRFLTGFFLAGIYPVGMKIAADHFQNGLGKSLGYLVGALALGTSLPHILSTFFSSDSWESVIILISALSILGGIFMLLFVGNGPYRQKAIVFKWGSVFEVFRPAQFKQAAFGYFGHMWELYAFWAFLPAIISIRASFHQDPLEDHALLTFAIIAVGGISCVISGYAATVFGIQKTAKVILIASGFCCLFSPLAIVYLPDFAFTLYLLLWGMLVIADSPLFSTLVANASIPKLKGTALTIVNCIGFSITIVSIQAMESVLKAFPTSVHTFMILAIGPVAGVFALVSKRTKVSRTL